MDFDSSCAGTPADWNACPSEFVLTDKRRWQQLAFLEPRGPASEMDVPKFLQDFLSSRPGPHSESLLARLGRIEPEINGWYRVPWLPLTSELPNPDDSQWQRGWHGCKMEALYSIMYHGCLFPSSEDFEGSHYFAQYPGVYLHGDTLQWKSEHYVRYVPFSDDLIWATKWELVYAAWGSVKRGKKTDQVIQSPDSVKLAALWLSAYSVSSAPHGSGFSLPGCRHTKPIRWKIRAVSEAPIPGVFTLQ